MAKNDMPGMKGQAPANPYEGMWGPIGGGNAAPYGGNSMPWLQGGQQGQQGGQGLGAILAKLAQARQAQQGPGIGQQNPNAAFNRPQMPGQGQPPFMGLQPPIPQPNAGGQSVDNMAQAASIGPSQNQNMIQQLLGRMGGGMIGGGMEMAANPMMGGNIPPNANALMQEKMPMMKGEEPQPIASYGAPPSPAESSVAPSFFSRFRQPRNG